MNNLSKPISRRSFFGVLLAGMGAFFCFGFKKKDNLKLSSHDSVGLLPRKKSDLRAVAYTPRSNA